MGSFLWLHPRYDACRSAIARVRSQQSGTSISSTTDPAHHLLKPNATCVRCSKWVAKGGTHLCPSCGHKAYEGNIIGHCLEHCESYLGMTVNQRSDCVQTAQWCPIHLTGTHNYENCTQKKDPKFVCGVSGCTKHHHRTLHGSTTPFMATVNTLQSGILTDFDYNRKYN